ncbi:helix-turn-helix transcriptional regulator [Kordia sp. YSTF-M3]|uniref:Helix-turn-helix transcriptional regulator n=1 Tax=Kordia aestuariivivens TaxID=2759037 RepID=A0ABR7Q677_9FLAO|nr:helix-turn-helix transcriptional regulator [Kordia aestuariivivens]MBC8754074.1 helix-turn-helix transcriptional regulator [Kordia aestuariivivens]
MSKIGANIRKIRLTKGYSQTQFAELFGLTRASIGAYEEGRAEPKIDAVIEIAKYFSISLDVIFTKNVTVNQLTNFNIAVTKDVAKSKSTSENTLQLNYIDFDALSDKKSLVAHFEKKQTLDKIDFPKIIGKADTYFNFKKGLIEGVHNQNIKGLICLRVAKPAVNAIVVMVSSNKIIVGNYISGTSTVSIKLVNTTEIKTYKGVKFFFEIKLFITSDLDILNYLDARLSKIEEQLSQIKS